MLIIDRFAGHYRARVACDACGVLTAGASVPETDSDAARRLADETALARVASQPGWSEPFHYNPDRGTYRRAHLCGGCDGANAFVGGARSGERCGCRACVSQRDAERYESSDDEYARGVRQLECQG